MLFGRVWRDVLPSLDAVQAALLLIGTENNTSTLAYQCLQLEVDSKLPGDLPSNSCSSSREHDSNFSPNIFLHHVFGFRTPNPAKFKHF